MKKNINVIQIKGFRGLIVAAFVVTCLIAGFGIFPGLIAMKLWNIVANYFLQVPSIGIFQGVLLWGIIVAAYFTFRKEKLIVCMKSPQGLTDEELKAVFADVKRQAQTDKIIQAMMKAKEAELKAKSSVDKDFNPIENSNIEIIEDNIEEKKEEIHF